MPPGVSASRSTSVQPPDVCSQNAAQRGVGVRATDANHVRRAVDRSRISSTVGVEDCLGAGRAVVEGLLPGSRLRLPCHLQSVVRAPVPRAGAQVGEAVPHVGRRRLPGRVRRRARGAVVAATAPWRDAQRCRTGYSKDRRHPSYGALLLVVVHGPCRPGALRSVQRHQARDACSAPCSGRWREQDIVPHAVQVRLHNDPA
jgi:hypothetical protein